MAMPNLSFALDTSSTATSGIGTFQTGGSNPFGNEPASLFGVPWYWFALAGVAGYLIYRRGGL